MKNFIKNTLLLVAVLILSYYTTEYFGTWYNKFAPLNDRSLIGLSTSDLISFIGLPFAYVFFTTLLFQVFGFGNRNKWTIWLLVPALLFFGAGDITHIYIPFALGLFALGLAKFMNLILRKFKIST